MLHPDQTAFFGAEFSMITVITFVYFVCTILYYSLYMEINFMSDLSGNVQVMFSIAIGTVIMAALGTGLMIMLLMLGKADELNKCWQSYNQ